MSQYHLCTTLLVNIAQRVIDDWALSKVVAGCLLGKQLIHSPDKQRNYHLALCRRLAVSAALCLSEHRDMNTEVPYFLAWRYAGRGVRRTKVTAGPSNHDCYHKEQRYLYILHPLSTTPLGHSYSRAWLPLPVLVGERGVLIGAMKGFLCSSLRPIVWYGFVMSPGTMQVPRSCAPMSRWCVLPCGPVRCCISNRGHWEQSSTFQDCLISTDHLASLSSRTQSRYTAFICIFSVFPHRIPTSRKLIIA